MPRSVSTRGMREHQQETVLSHASATGLAQNHLEEIMTVNINTTKAQSKASNKVTIVPSKRNSYLQEIRGLLSAANASANRDDFISFHEHLANVTDLLGEYTKCVKRLPGYSK